MPLIGGASMLLLWCGLWLAEFHFFCLYTGSDWWSSDDVFYVQPLIGGVCPTFAIYNLQLAEFGWCLLCITFDWQNLDGVCYVQPPFDGVWCYLTAFSNWLSLFDTIRWWSLISGVIDEVKWQAPVGRVIFDKKQTILFVLRDPFFSGIWSRCCVYLQRFR